MDARQVAHGVDDARLQRGRVRDLQQGVHVVQVNLPEPEDLALVGVHGCQGHLARGRAEEEVVAALRVVQVRVVPYLFEHGIAEVMAVVAVVVVVVIVAFNVLVLVLVY